MSLNIHDFPIRFEDGCIKNKKGEILLNFSKRLQREKVISFILELLPAVNDGRRVFKKRLTKTLDKSLEESIDIIKQEMFEQGFIPSKGVSEIEYNIISKKEKNSKKVEFNKVIIKNTELIGQEFLQNCGDSLRVLKKSEQKQGSTYLFECEFIKYPYKILAPKRSIIKGWVLNPRIEIEEFINKEFLQNCGDSLKVLKKSEQKQGKYSLFECEFIKYPYKILALKDKIIKGQVLNPQIEQVEFIDKIWPQHCGDSLRIIRKTNQKINKNNNYLYECEFINYPYRILSFKHNILRGEVLNPKAPWVDVEETQVRDFIKSIYNGKIEKYSGKKEDNYYEIDIYLPELKKGIEYNGSPWHEEGNPNNPFSKPLGYHKNKKEIFIKKGIDILFIWDYEWFEDFPKNKIIREQTKQKIREFLNLI